MSNSETSPRIEIPPGVTRERVEQASREFATVFHDLKEQTFATTTWLGVPLVKTPPDMVVLQQIIVETRPELIVETGVYVGGSAMLFASIQEALGIDGKVIAVDVDLSFVHEQGPRATRGSSCSRAAPPIPEIVSQIRAAAKGKRTMVDLDSDHRAHHVLEELRTYSDLVSPNCYLVVEDSWFGGRPVREDAIPGPSEALDAWLAEEPPFELDRWRERYLLTQNPRGYLRRMPGRRRAAARPRAPGQLHDRLLRARRRRGRRRGRARSTPRRSPRSSRPPRASPTARSTRCARPSATSPAGTREAAVASDLDERRAEITTENLLREINTQRELLEERNRQLAISAREPAADQPVAALPHLDEAPGAARHPQLARHRRARARERLAGEARAPRQGAGGAHRALRQPPSRTVIAFGAAIADEEKWERYALRGIQLRGRR